MRKSPWLMSVSPQIEKRQKPETRVYRVGVFAASAHLLMPLSSFMLCCTPSLELVTETDTGIVGRSPVRPIGDRAAASFCSPVGTLDEAVLHPRRHHVGVRIAIDYQRNRIERTGALRGACIGAVGYPTGFWYFNPFCWQFLFVFGGWFALGGSLESRPLIRSRALLSLGGAYLIFALVMTMAGRFPELAQLMPAWGRCVQPQ